MVLIEPNRRSWRRNTGLLAHRHPEAMAGPIGAQKGQQVAGKIDYGNADPNGLALGASYR